MTLPCGKPVLVSAKLLPQYLCTEVSELVLVHLKSSSLYLMQVLMFRYTEESTSLYIRSQAVSITPFKDNIARIVNINT